MLCVSSPCPNSTSLTYNRAAQTAEKLGVPIQQERGNPEKSARRIVSDGHAQLVSLEEEVLAGGGVKFTVHRKPTWTQSLVDMFSSGLFGIAACMIPNVDVRWGLFVGGFAWVLQTISHVQQGTYHSWVSKFILT